MLGLIITRIVSKSLAIPGMVCYMGETRKTPPHIAFTPEYPKDLVSVPARDHKKGKKGGVVRMPHAQLIATYWAKQIYLILLCTLYANCQAS